jgi:hypothetical protein
MVEEVMRDREIASSNNRISPFTKYVNVFGVLLWFLSAEWSGHSAKKTSPVVLVVDPEID